MRRPPRLACRPRATALGPILGRVASLASLVSIARVTRIAREARHGAGARLAALALATLPALAFSAFSAAGASARTAAAASSPSTKASAKPSSSGPPAVLRAELNPDPEAVHPEYAACPASLALTTLDPDALVAAVRQRCRNLRVPPNATPTEIASDDAFVAICVRDKTAIDARQCGMKLQAVVVGSDGASTNVPLVADGELVLSLRGSKLEAVTPVENGTPFSLAITTQTSSPNGLEIRNGRTPLVFRRTFQAYGAGRWLWLPMPMLTSDLSSSAGGYRLGITPLALAAGTRWSPGATRAYVGASVFVGWNLLVPNDTQSLTNGTQVRVNYKAFGGGVLFDLAGWLGIGVGVGRTFTSDARTDLRTWLYVGPRTLKFLGDL